MCSKILFLIAQKTEREGDMEEWKNKKGKQ
jgi:hypothetical protein